MPASEGSGNGAEVDCQRLEKLPSVQRFKLVMGKLVRTIVIIIIAFTLASLFLYRLRLGHGESPRRQSTRTGALIEVEGQVSEVDEGEGRLVLTERDQNIVLKFDALTSITDSGEAVSASAIKPGSMATVRYTERNGRNRARSISLIHAPPGSY